jgi:hypothetical protein
MGMSRKKVPAKKEKARIAFLGLRSLFMVNMVLRGLDDFC